MIGGPLNGSSSIHMCLAAHLWRSGEEDIYDEDEDTGEIQCTQLCTQDVRSHSLMIQMVLIL